MRTVLYFLLCALMYSSARAAIEDRLPRYQTKYYILHTDVDRAFADDLHRRLDLMYEEYSRRLAAFARATDAPRFDVYVFSKRSDYDEFTSHNAPNSAGIFMPGRNALAAFAEGQPRDTLRKTLQHEAFHQFAFTAIARELPMWLNEGLAQVFEEAIFTGDRFSLGEVPPQRLRQLSSDITARRLTPFRAFLVVDDKQWQENMRDKTRGAAEYSQAWAMTHFLVFATDDASGWRFRARLIEMLKRLHEGRPGDLAFADVFGDNIEGFQQRFIEYARHLAATPTAICIERQQSLADCLIMFKREGRRFDTAAQFRSAVTGGRWRFTRQRGVDGTEETIDRATLVELFSDPSGRQLDDRQISFAWRRGAPLDDLICRPMPGLTLTTLFRDAGGNRIEQELTIEQR